MSKFSQKLPSAGVILGMLALVMAIAGTAIAGSAPQGKVTPKKVKSIVKRLAPSLNVNSAKTANSAKIATNVLSANVLADGTMLGSIPSGATSQLHAGDGQYDVSFGRDLTGCTISGSSADNTNDPAVGMVAVGVLNSTTLRVITLDQHGNGAQRSFYVQAICPA